MILLGDRFKVAVVLVSMLFVLTLILGCGKGDGEGGSSKSSTMSNEDFNNITAEFTGAINHAWLTGELNFNMKDKEMEKFILNKLDEVCQKYGYHKDEYERKGEEIGLNWRDKIKKTK
ncbi:hypothetical protein MUP77_16475 [Candidatus Bathyarchaeota archaeon]|nr:hypothetical protein [Candidatus Bathyarchaeota archaeon]